MLLLLWWSLTASQALWVQASNTHLLVKGLHMLLHHARLVGQLLLESGLLGLQLPYQRLPASVGGWGVKLGRLHHSNRGF